MGKINKNIEYNAIEKKLHHSYAEPELTTANQKFIHQRQMIHTKNRKRVRISAVHIYLYMCGTISVNVNDNEITKWYRPVK